MFSRQPTHTRFALIGAGRIGSIHFRNLVLSERAEPVWVLEEKEQLAKELVSRYQLGDKVKTCHISKLEDVLADVSIDAVLVCSPSDTHEGIIKASLNKGKAVFCEKPLTNSLQATAECYDLATSKVLFCAFNRRYDPQIRKLYNAVRAGEVGKLRYIHQTARDYAGSIPEEYLKIASDILLDSMIHDIDVALWLVGEMPSSVYCIGHVINETYAKYNQLDTCFLTMTFPNGVVCTINVLRETPYGYDQRIEVTGTKGMLESKNQCPLSLNNWTPGGTTADPIYTTFLERYMDSYRIELEHFLDVVQNGAPEEVTKESTVNVYRVIEMAQKSMKLGQIVKP